jgi:hypothetical protein
VVDSIAVSVQAARRHLEWLHGGGRFEVRCVRRAGKGAESWSGASAEFAAARTEMSRTANVYVTLNEVCDRLRHSEAAGTGTSSGGGIC